MFENERKENVSQTLKFFLQMKKFFQEKRFTDHLWMQYMANGLHL